MLYLQASLDAPIDISLDESTPKEDEAEPSATIVDDDNDDVIECEIIKQEVPFEDLTVSDCESVHEEKEENPKIEEPVEVETSCEQSTVNDIETKDEGSALCFNVLLVVMEINKRATNIASFLTLSIHFVSITHQKYTLSRCNT